MTKFFKYFMMVLIAVVAVSCSKDEPESNGGDIVGTWVCKNFYEGESFTMCFKSDGTGWMEWSDDDEREDFEYTTKDGSIFFEGWGESWVCTYVIKGNKLTIYGNPWGEDDDIDVINFTKK